jgi:hypothetical protein
LLEQNAFPGHFVEVRGAEVGAVTGQVPVAEVVGKYENDVGWGSVLAAGVKGLHGSPGGRLAEDSAIHLYQGVYMSVSLNER